MRLRSRVALIAAVFLVASFGLSSAWNGPGHEQIADIAWTKLNDKAKTEITKILKAADPAWRPADNSESALRAAFRKAATFPDYIKTHHDTVYETVININQLNKKFEPNIEADGTDPERFRCKTFHYYDTPLFFFDPAHPPAIRASNATVALDFARSELGRIQHLSHKSRQKQFFWLAWVEHITGDLHQPLHCAENWSAPFHFDASGDNGGNAFKIKKPDSTSNTLIALHSYWDSGIDHAKDANPATSGISVEDVTTAWIWDASIQPSASAVANLDHRQWIADGAIAARDKAYGSLQPNDRPDGNYVDAHVDVCRKRAVLAGYRLAALLNQILGQ